MTINWTEFLEGLIAFDVKMGPTEGTGTVTNVGTGTGLTGGPITTTGTISLAPINAGLVLSNITSGSAAPLPNTMTAILDKAFSNVQGDILYRGASTWSALAPSTAGYVLQTGGAAANPSWVAAGSASNFTYLTAYWVAQNNGSDLNAGTSINTPLATFQKAIDLFAASVSPTTCVIYGVDANINNTETITTPGLGVLIHINAPGVNFNGTITASDSLFIKAQTIASFTSGIDENYLSVNSLGSFNSSGSVINYIDFQQATGTITVSGGTQYINSAEGCGIIASSGANVNITGGGAFSIANDGTAVINGFTGAVNSGLSGDSIVSGTLTIGTAHTVGDFYILPDTDGTSGQVPVTNGTGTVSWTTIGTGNIDWVSISGTSEAGAINTYYKPTNVGRTTITMPSVAPFGSLIGVEGFGTGGWTLQAAAGQNFWVYGVVSSTAGTLSSTDLADNAYLVCIVANSTWKVQSTNSQGLTIV